MSSGRIQYSEKKPTGKQKKPVFYLSIKHRKSVFYCFARVKSIYSRNVDNTRLWLGFSTFPSCSQIPVVFYHSVIHSLGFFIC